MRRPLLTLATLISFAIPAHPLGQTVVVTYPGAPPAQACTSELSEWAAVNGTTGSRWLCNGTSWVQLDPTVPSGMIAFVDTGSCPTGWNELADAGSYLLLTQAANADVGTTGGSTAYTPAGTLSMNAITSVINHTHTVTVTDPGHTHTANATTYTEQAQGSTTASTTGTHVMTSTSTGGSLRSVESTVSKAPTINSATTGITATTANPVGGVASITPTGSFSGTPATIQPTYLKLIACKKA